MIINEQHYLARYISAFSSKYSELNEYQLYAMHEKTPIIKNCAKLFLFQCQIPKKKHPEIAMHIYIYNLYYFQNVALNPNFNESCALANSIILRERFTWSYITLDHFNKNAGLYKMEPVYVKESKVHRHSYPKSRRFLLNSHFCGSPAPRQHKAVHFLIISKTG